MKNLSTILAVSAIAAGSLLSSCQKNAGSASMSGNAVPQNAADSFFYAIGAMNGIQFEQEFGSEINTAAFMAGLNNSLKKDSANALFKTPQEMQIYVRTFLQKKAEIKAQENLAAGQKFLEEIAKKDGIQKTESGIYYEIITKGEGAIPTAEDMVECHYTGTFINGDVFDSSVKRGQPAQFPVQGVIKGWQDILKIMPVGSKWKVYIPSDLAYGPYGNQSIPGNSTLVFEMELLQIIKQDADKK